MAIRFDPSGFCAFAASLNERWPYDEASVRTTISRAYYGALISARDAKGLRTRQQVSSHKLVLDAYRASTAASDQVIANTLQSMKERREEADYEPETACTTRGALQAVRAAEKVLTALGISTKIWPTLVDKGDNLQTHVRPPPAS